MRRSSREEARDPEEGEQEEVREDAEDVDDMRQEPLTLYERASRVRGRRTWKPSSGYSTGRRKWSFERELFICLERSSFRKRFFSGGEIRRVKDEDFTSDIL